LHTRMHGQMCCMHVQTHIHVYLAYPSGTNNFVSAFRLPMRMYLFVFACNTSHFLLPAPNPDTSASPNDKAYDESEEPKVRSYSQPPSTSARQNAAYRNADPAIVLMADLHPTVPAYRNAASSTAEEAMSQAARTPPLLHQH